MSDTETTRFSFENVKKLLQKEIEKLKDNEWDIDMDTES